MILDSFLNILGEGDSLMVVLVQYAEVAAITCMCSAV